jgi:hypothetical protein
VPRRPEPLHHRLGTAVLPLTVSDAYRAQFQAFSVFFKSEMLAIADDTLSMEVTVLDKLAQ